MRFTNVLYRQHIDRMFKRHWRLQGQRVPIDTGAVAALQAKGIPVYEPKEVLAEKLSPLDLQVIGFKPLPRTLDGTHTNWHDRKCFVIGDDNVLLEGIEQAKLLTKTVEILGNLPKSLQLTDEVPNDIDHLTEQAILSAHLFDAEQKKLKIMKDPTRPAWNFPRQYGITNSRKMKTLMSQLLFLCDTRGKSTTTERMCIESAEFSLPFEKDEDLIQFQFQGDKFLLSRDPLSKIYNRSTEDISLPNLHPIKHTISIPRLNIYELQNLYPVENKHSFWYPHTLFIYHDENTVKNLYETEVTEQQVLGRGLIKCFTAAASFARQKFGNGVQDLPEPITIQCVNTNGKFYHFGVLQLNTLNLNGMNGVKNVWFNLAPVNLYASCEYKQGRSNLEGYNPFVIRQLMAMYNNQ